MRKITAVLLSFAMAISFAGCGEEDKIPEGMPEPFYNAGVGIVGVLDEVIDVKIDKETACDKAELYLDVLDDYSGLYEEYDESSEEYERYLRYSTISVVADSIIWKLGKPEFGNFTDYTIEEILEDRNSFAKNFGLESRESNN